MSANYEVENCSYAGILRNVPAVAETLNAEPENLIDSCDVCVSGVRQVGAIPCSLRGMVEQVLSGEIAPGSARTPPYSSFATQGAAGSGREGQRNPGGQPENEEHAAILNYLRVRARQPDSNLSPGRTSPVLDTHAGRLTSEIVRDGTVDVENLNVKEIHDSIYLILAEIRRHPELTEGRRLSDYEGVIKLYLEDVAALERAGLKGREFTRRVVALRYSSEYITNFINQVGRTAASRACMRNPRDPVGEHSRFMEWKESKLREYSDRVGGHTLDRFYWHGESGQHDALFQRYLNRLYIATERIVPQLSPYRASVTMGTLRKLCETTIRYGEGEFLSALGELEQRIRRSGR